MVRFSLPDGVFLPCDHGLDFWHQLITVSIGVLAHPLDRLSRLDCFTTKRM